MPKVQIRKKKNIYIYIYINIYSQRKHFGLEPTVFSSGNRRFIGKDGDIFLGLIHKLSALTDGQQLTS